MQAEDSHEMNSGSDVSFSEDSDSKDSDTSREACSMQRKPSPLPNQKTCHQYSWFMIVVSSRDMLKFVRSLRVALHCSCLVVARQMGWFYEYTQICPGSREVSSSSLDNDPALLSRCIRWELWHSIRIVTSDVSYNRSMS